MEEAEEIKASEREGGKKKEARLTLAAKRRDVRLWIQPLSLSNIPAGFRREIEKESSDVDGDFRLFTASSRPPV